MQMLTSQSDLLTKMTDEMNQTSLQTTLDSTKKLNNMIDQIRTNSELNDKYLDALIMQNN
jgi:hypothetical protein